MRKIFVLLVLLMLVFCLPTMAEDVTPTLGDDSAYTLTEVESSAGDNVISRPYYNKETGELSVKHYSVYLRKTEYGEGGKSTTVNVEVIDKEVPVTVKYDNSATKTYTKVYSSAITNMSTITIDNAIFENVNSTSTLVNNKGKIRSLICDFISNSVTIKYSLSGGGIVGNYANVYDFSNTATATIGNITGDFVNNTVTVNYDLFGGGIVGNYAYANNSSATATATIGDITGDFFNNTVTVNSYHSLYGGGIVGIYAYAGSSSTTTATIGDITGDFLNNTVTGNSYSSLCGGGIVGNYAYANKSSATATIGDITGDFVNNTVTVNSSLYGGGIVGNYTYASYSATTTATIGDITGDFLNNTVTTSSSLDGGGIVGNYAHAYNSSATATIGDITGDFLNNNVTVGYALYGGGIVGIRALADSSSTITATIGDITGDFLNNTVNSNYLYGGGIVGNYTYATSSATTTGTIGDITGDFLNNTVSVGNYSYGGVIGNYSANTNSYANIGQINSNFYNNSVVSTGTTTDSNFIYGGAISNYGVNSTIQGISGDFVANGIETKSTGGDIKSFGGAIYNSGTITNGITNSSFIGNYAKSTVTAQGGAIYTNKDLTLTADNYQSVFSGNYTESNEIRDNNAIFVTHSASINFKMSNGGSFVMNDNIRGLATENDFYQMYSVSNFNDYAKTQGFSDNVLETIAHLYGASSVEELLGWFGCSSVEELLQNTGYDSIDELALNYFGISGNNATEQFLSAYGIDSVDKFLEQQGIGEYSVNIEGDDIDRTTFYLFNDMHNANVTINNTTLNTINNDVHTYHFNSFTITGDTKMVADVDLANKQMDRITANSYGTHTGNIQVVGMNLLSDAKSNKTAIYFAESGLKNNVSAGDLALPDNYQQTVYSPIYKYTVTYDKDKIYDSALGDGGYFVFSRSASGGSNRYNPSVLASSVSQQTGTYTAQLNTFNYSFQHAEIFMNLPSAERLAYKNRNKYALSNVGVFSPLMTGAEDTGFWIKPYATFENIPLKNGPKVNSISYGTLVGYDELMVSLKRGWDRVFTYYLGYNGASQNYSGVDCYQNGGLLGATMTLYKGNFFTATTLSAGATVGEAHTMYGTEYSTTMFAGIGNKTGYNIEFNQGKFIVQPSMLLAYTFLNTFDYKNAAGVQINSDPTSMIQIAPTVRFVVNTKKGWQPYLAVGMVWNILAHSDIRANNEELPDMYTKPYVQYGLGIQRVIKDRFTAFGQAMIYNGGRNGVSLMAGIRWAIGK